MGFFEVFNWCKKKEIVEPVREKVEEVEEKVDSDEGIKVIYWLDAEFDKVGSSDFLYCSLCYQCEELGIKDSTKLFSNFAQPYMESWEVVKELEKVLNTPREDLERIVVNVIKKVLGEQTNREKIDELVKAINNRKGVVFVKK